MGDFSAYWKIVTVAFAGVFAILGAYFDIRDKQTGKVTSWGRIFLVLTILSIVGGLYAQWDENAAAQRKNALTQDQMLKLLRNTNRDLYELSRVIQPLDKAEITVFLKPDCDADVLRQFCRETLKEADLESLKSRFIRENASTSSTTIKTPRWKLFPDRILLLDVYIFKEQADAQRFLKSGLAGCDWCGDIAFKVMSTAGVDNAREHALLFYETPKKRLSLMVSTDYEAPRVHSDRVMSTIDLPGSTIVVTAASGLLDHFYIDSILLHTQRGQEIEINDLALRNITAIAPKIMADGGHNILKFRKSTTKAFISTIPKRPIQTHYPITGFR